MTQANTTVAQPTIVLDLKKKFELNLIKANILNVPILQARAAIDKSGSMDNLFKRGWVDTALDLFIGAALKFDDNGELEVGFFNTNFQQTSVATADDGGKYMLTKGKSQYAGGGTSFAPIIESFENWPKEEEKKPGFFAGLFAKKAPSDIEPQLRAYVGVITDGDNGDRRQFEEILDKTDGNTFYQFIGIGDGVDKSYLESISKRYKHVSFVHIKDPTKMTPDSFYAELCNPKFAAWI
jgi:hypothetical protein